MTPDPNSHGLSARWRQRLQDLDLVLGVVWKGIKIGGFLAGVLLVLVA